MTSYLIWAIIAIGLLIILAIAAFPKIAPSLEKAEDIIEDKQHPERNRLLAQGAIWISLLILLLVIAVGYGLSRLFVTQVDRMAPPSVSPHLEPTYTPIPTYFNPSEI